MFGPITFTTPDGIKVLEHNGEIYIHSDSVREMMLITAKEVHEATAKFMDNLVKERKQP